MSAETEESVKSNGFRSCYDKLRKAVSNIPADSSKSAKLQNLSSRRISEILPNLYLAGRTVSQNSELLKEKNITTLKLLIFSMQTVINVSDREVPNYALNHPFVRHYRFFPISDTADAKFDGIIETAVRLIHESRIRGEGVLVHCFLGVSRSATLVAFYLISVFGMKWRDAVDYVHKRRSSASPNLGFLQQLKDFSNTKAEDARLQLTSERCHQLRQSDCDVIQKYLPVLTLEL